MTAPALYIVALFTALLGLVAPASAQSIPALTALPATVAASNPALVDRRAALTQERTALHAKINNLNMQCSAVEEGSAAAASCKRNQATLLSALDSHIQQTKDFNARAQGAIITSIGQSPLNDTLVVDARNVPTGLPKSVETEIPNTPAGNRVRKGFEAIVDRDWNVAHAWFQDALNHEPGNAGIQRLIDLAEYTMNRPKVSGAPKKPILDTSAQDKVTMELHNKQMDAHMSTELAKALLDFNRNYSPKHSVASEKTEPANNDGSFHEKSASTKVTQNWKAFFDALFVRPPKIYGAGFVRD